MAHGQAAKRQEALTSRASRDQPWLLPTNRKLRHLHGLSLRNLTFPDTSRKGGTSTDDEGLLQSWQSPTKLRALQENAKLEHSHSSTDLPVRSGSVNLQTMQSGLLADSNAFDPQGNMPRSSTHKRPQAGKLRRRSTLNWAGASPDVRQKKLEDVMGARMGDTFLSIHVDIEKEPVYITEVVDRAMNPDFQPFDLKSQGSSISRLDKLTLRLWAKPSSVPEYTLLVELDLDLSSPSLLYLGESLETSHHSLPPNAIILHLTDGLYTMDIPPVFPLSIDKPLPLTSSLHTAPLPTSNYDALFRLSTLTDCISDALITQVQLTNQITTLLSQQSPSSSRLDTIFEAEDHLASTRRYLALERRGLALTTTKRDSFITSLAARRQTMAIGITAQTKAHDTLQSSSTQFDQSKQTLAATQEAITSQQQRICAELLRIFPIEPPHESDKEYIHTIRGLPLPNTPIPVSTAPAPLAAALGLAAQVVDHLQLYLSIPLPYPILLRGSTTTIEDPIAASLPSKERIFPLFPSRNGGHSYKFEYGVFLLNKDIEALAQGTGIRIGDLRHTLDNLHTVLTGIGNLAHSGSGATTPILRIVSGIDSEAAEEVLDARLEDAHRAVDTPASRSQLDGAPEDPSSSSREPARMNDHARFLSPSSAARKSVPRPSSGLLTTANSRLAEMA